MFKDKMVTNIIRRKERTGTSSQASNTRLMDGELGVLTDVKKLIVGDGSKKGGYCLTPDNIVANCTDQADPNENLSLAWWINYANGSDIKLRIVSGVYNFLNDLSIPSNVYLDVDKGTVFNISSEKTLTLNCEVSIDFDPEFFGEGIVIENYVKKYFINENLISHKRHLWHEGRLNGNDGTIANGPEDDVELLRRYHIHSDLFDIEPNTVYTAKAWSKECRGYFLFFDEDKQFIPESSIAPTYLELQAGYTFTTPATAKYIAVDSYLPYSIPTSNYYAVTSMNDLGWKHLYKVEKGTHATEFTPSRRDSQEAVPFASNERPKNDPESARQLVACAESYKGKGWVYGQDPSREDTYTEAGPAVESLFDNGIKQIDCQTLMVLALNGIPYYQSKYFDNSLPWRGVHYYPWGKYPNHIWIEGFSLWCYYNGWEIDPGINYNKLEAGDIIFYGKIDYPADSNSGWKRTFRYIDHVAMYTGRWVPDPNRNNELHPQSIEVLQDQPIVTNNFIDRISNSGKEIKMIIRMPLESPYGEFDSDINKDGVFYSTSYKPAVYAVGNGEKLKIDIYGRTYSGWEMGVLSNGEKAVSNKRIRTTDFIPWDVVNHRSWLTNQSALHSAGYTTSAYVRYDKDLNYISVYPSADATAKYAKIMCYKYDPNISNPSIEDAQTITNEDFVEFSRMAGVQRNGRDTIEYDNIDQTHGSYEQAFHSWAYIETVIPSGAILELHNGKYAYTSDNKYWIELPETDQIKLNNLRIHDGENNIYICNGQTVKLIHKSNVDSFEISKGSGGLYVAFGDSIVYGYTADETPRRSAYNYIAAIGKVTGLDETINAAVGGQGQFSAGSNSEGNAYSWLTSHENLITRATLITLAWGKNDRNYTLGTSSDTESTDTICGRWKKCLNYIRSVNSDAQIIIISSIKYANVGWDEPLGTGNWSLDDLAREVGAVAEQYNIPYITWKKCGVMNNLGVRAHDNTHPDSFTYKLMGAYIAGQIGYWFRNVWNL